MKVTATVRVEVERASSHGSGDTVLEQTYVHVAGDNPAFERREIMEAVAEAAGLVSAAAGHLHGRTA